MTDTPKREIILPVKCSTVRKLHKWLEQLQEVELWILVAMFPISVIFDFWMMTRVPPDVYLSQILGFIWKNFFMVRVMVCVLLCVAISAVIAENFPTIKCTEDEPEYKGGLEIGVKE